MKKGDKETTFWEALSEYPPYFVRLLAKRSREEGNLAISDAELAIASAIPLTRVREISKLESWDTVMICEMTAFTAACNFDPMNFKDRNRAKQYLYVCKKRKSTPFYYLRKDKKWPTEFLPLIKMLASRLGRPAIAEQEE